MLALVIDDSRVERELLARILESAGITVARASGGQEAIELIDSDLQPDVVFVDIHMPGMDGIELVRHLRAHHMLPSAKIIMVSSSDDERTITKALECGADEYVMKPYTPDAIVHKLSFVLEGFDHAS